MPDLRPQALSYHSPLARNPATAFRENGVAATVKAILAEIGLEHQPERARDRGVGPGVWSGRRGG